jgi:hypothetical protein
MTISQSTDFKAAGLVGRLAFIATGATFARVRIYGTTRPANGADPGGAYLAEIPLLDPPGEVAGLTLTLYPPDDAIVSLTGIAVWGRLINGDGTHVIDGDVTNEGAGGDFQLNTVNLYLGGVVRLVSAAFTG